MNTDHESKWEQRYASIPKPVKVSFYACVIIGLLVHLFAFTNIIPNSDGLSRIYDTQQMTISGRWFLHYASMIHGYIQAPSLIGILSLLFLGLSAAMVTDLMKLRRTPSAIACGAFLAVFPSMAYTYLYMFTASAYTFGIFLAVLSVWIFRKYKHGLIPAAIFLACSMGTYQAYFAVAVSIGLICVILDLLDSNQPLDKIVKNGFRMLGMMLLGAVFYYIALQVFLHVKDLSLLNYRGIGTVGSGLSLGTLVHSLLSTYKQLFFYFLVPFSASYNTTALTAAHWILMLCVIFSLYQIIKTNKMIHQRGRFLLLVLAFALTPMAFNFTQLLSDSSPNMRYSFVFVYILAIALMEGVHFDHEKISSVLKKLACISCALIILICAQITNLAYTSSATAHRATEAFATNLVSRVEQTPGYTSDMEVVIVGAFPRNVYHSNIDAFKLVEHYSCMSDTVMMLNKHVYYYLNDWLNIPWAEPDESTMISISDSDAFQNMPLYPDDGSVVIDNNRVIVKLAPNYIPKRPYEIEYENRH